MPLGNCVRSRRAAAHHPACLDCARVDSRRRSGREGGAHFRRDGLRARDIDRFRHDRPHGPVRNAQPFSRAVPPARASFRICRFARSDRRGSGQRERVVVDSASACRSLRQRSLPGPRGRFRGTADAAPAPPDDAGAIGTSGSLPNDDHGETAWRLRHARRGILKDAVLPDDIFGDGDAPPANGIRHKHLRPGHRLLHAVSANFFTGTPFSGQVNLLTTSSFETPQQLFSTDSFARSIAYVSVGAPVDHADWTVRGAMTQGDIASWIVAGEYVTRVPARHRFDLGSLVCDAAVRCRQPVGAARLDRRKP